MAEYMPLAKAEPLCRNVAAFAWPDGHERGVALRTLLEEYDRRGREVARLRDDMSRLYSEAEGYAYRAREADRARESARRELERARDSREEWHASCMEAFAKYAEVVVERDSARRERDEAMAARDAARAEVDGGGRR